MLGHCQRFDGGKGQHPNRQERDAPVVFAAIREGVQNVMRLGIPLLDHFVRPEQPSAVADLDDLRERDFQAASRALDGDRCRLDRYDGGATSRFNELPGLSGGDCRVREDEPLMQPARRRLTEPSKPCGCAGHPTPRTTLKGRATSRSSEWTV